MNGMFYVNQKPAGGVRSTVAQVLANELEGLEENDPEHAKAQIEFLMSLVMGLLELNHPTNVVGVLEQAACGNLIQWVRK